MWKINQFFKYISIIILHNKSPVTTTTVMTARPICYEVHWSSLVPPLHPRPQVPITTWWKGNHRKPGGWWWGKTGDWWVGRMTNLLVPPPAHMLRWISGGVGLGTGKWAKDGPDGKLGLGTLHAHNFVFWASSYIVSLKHIKNFTRRISLNRS